MTNYLSLSSPAWPAFSSFTQGFTLILKLRLSKLIKNSKKITRYVNPNWLHLFVRKFPNM